VKTSVIEEIETKTEAMKNPHHWSRRK